MTDYTEHGAIPAEDALTPEELDQAWREAQQNPNLSEEDGRGAAPPENRDEPDRPGG